LDNNPGKTITFSWQSSGGQTARIYNWANGSMRFPAFWDVPLNGTLTVDLPETRRSNPRFILHIYADDYITVSDSAVLEIPWACSLAYFFNPNPVICPATEPTYTTAIEQQFQGGRMIWLQEFDWIYVLYDGVILYGREGVNLHWERYDDKWNEDIVGADLSTSPPPGLYAPFGGFGLVWRENQSVQEILGWALALETTFDGAWQPQPSDTDNEGDSLIFIALENGQVAELGGYDTWGWLWTAFDPISP
jgi:hypothetical protein